MSFAATGFPGGSSTRSSMLALLAGYTGMEYTLLYLVVVEIFKLANRPSRGLERCADVVVALILLVTGVCLVTSEAVDTYCDDLLVQRYWHCKNLKAAFVLAFAAAFSFLLTLVLSFVATIEPPERPRVESEEPVSYHQQVDLQRNYRGDVV